MKILSAILVGLLLFCTPACTSIDEQDVKDTISFVIETAYNAGGKTALNTKLDELVTDGKLTQEQADVLKAAAEKGYEELLSKLKEVKD